MSIIDRLKGKRQDETAKLWRDYAALIRRGERELGKPKNESRLAELMEALRLSPDDLRAHLDLLVKHEKLKAESVVPDGLHEQAAQAGRELREFERVTIPQTRARLRGIISNAQVTGQTCARAGADAQNIERQHPELFGGTPRPPAEPKPSDLQFDGKVHAVAGA